MPAAENGYQILILDPKNLEKKKFFLMDICLNNTQNTYDLLYGKKLTLNNFISSDIV